MDFKSILSQLDQLNEAEGTTVHKGTYGTSYGKEDVRDQYGHKIGKINKDAEEKKDAPKKGRGRPKKGADETGKVKNYDFSAFGVNQGKDVKLPKHDKKKTVKHSLKEYLDQLDTALNEADQIQIKPASQMPKKPGQPGQTTQPGQPQQVQGQPTQNTQVIAQGNKTLGTVNNPQLAQQIKQSIGKGEMTLMPDQQVNELDAGTVASYQDKAFDKFMGGDDKRAHGLTRAYKKQVGAFGHVPTTQKVNEKDIGKHNNATTGFDALVRKLTPKYGVEAAKRIAGSQMKKIKEAEMPTHDGDMGAGLGAGRSQQFEAKDLPGKQDKLDVAEPKGKLDAKDFKELSKKKKVKEGMNTRLKAARHSGKAHALGKQGYNCAYDDMEESRHYHEGFKEGLDECYGQMPIQGYVGEEEGGMPAATVPGMASQEEHGGMDEGNAFTAALKRTPTGGKFSVGGKSFTDNSAIEESPFAFEAWDKELNALLESKADVAEGMTVSISKGQQGSPDSVSVSAQDGEADQLLDIIKSAGLGLFGGDNSSGYGAPQGELQHGGLDVVGDHDGMMALIKKVTGGEAGNGDYADEVGPEEHGEEACGTCGASPCGCDSEEGQQMVDEVESEDQMTYQMAEDNPPDSGADNTDAAIADTQQANQAAAEYNPSDDIDEGAGGPEASEEPEEELTPNEEDQSDEEGEEEESAEEEDKADKESMSESMFVNLYKKLTLISEESTSEKDDKAEKASKKVAKDIEYDEGHKGKDDDKAEKAGKEVKKDIEYDDKKDKKKIDEWANEAGPGKSASDTAFETDIDFMMNIISGGLNKRKSTGQTTTPVIASLNRTTSQKTTDINESVEYSSDAVAQWKKLAGLK